MSAPMFIYNNIEVFLFTTKKNVVYVSMYK